MKIARFQWQGGVSWGIIEGDSIFSLEGSLYGDLVKGERLCHLKDVKLLAPVEPSIMVASMLASCSRRSFLFIRLSAPQGEKDAIASSNITKAPFVEW